nr:radical SAM protein [Roseomonas acroporae]
MRILLINPPYLSLTSTWGVGHQVPLGLLSIAGPLADAGHTVRLLDAEARRLSLDSVARAVAAFAPEVVMTGHAGSTPAHATCLATLRAAREAAPGAVTVYGGVHPTYHAAGSLAEAPWLDVVVRGEGEATTLALVEALARGEDPATVPGLVLRRGGQALPTGEAPVIRDLDACRVAWELVEDWDLYRCFGLGRAVVVQFSRGCPHRCSYCGQYQFWVRWRFRTPARMVEEIVTLHRRHGVRFVDLADENPTSSKRLWREFLERLAAERLPVRLFATIRAADIVRDADMLDLYRAAGIVCVLMGIETTDAGTLAAIRKGSTTATDQQAVALLRRHGILSMLGHIVGFEEERAADYWRALRQIRLYDPDLLNAMYVTPHRWSDWTAENAGRRVIQADPTKWDYRHQLLETRHLRPWQVFALVKLTEAVVHLRPRALWRLLRHPDPVTRQCLRWCFRNSARVWLAEVAEFLFRTRFEKAPRTLAEWFGVAAPAAMRPDTVPAGGGRSGAAPGGADAAAAGREPATAPAGRPPSGTPAARRPGLVAAGRIATNRP